MSIEDSSCGGSWRSYNCRYRRRVRLSGERAIHRHDDVLINDSHNRCHYDDYDGYDD